MEHGIVYKDENAYTCFPAIVCKQNGEFMASFRRAGGFSLDALRQGLYDHVDKGARIGLSTSKDGFHWAPAQIMPQFDPECGEQDPSVTQLADGSLIINYFRWRVVPKEEKNRLKYPTRQQYDGSWSDYEGPLVLRSFDDGQTWQPPTAVPSTPLLRAGTSDAVAQLPDGTLILGYYGANPDESVCRAYSIRSKDGGQTWSDPVLIAEDPNKKISFEEPALCVTNSGRLIAMIRSGEPRNYQYLHQAFSDDGGLSWHSLEQTPMWGHPAHVLRLADGRLLCSYGYRRAPFGIRACLSTDEGKSWDITHEVILRDDGASRDCGYPCSAQMADGSILTVYYIHGEDGIRHIAWTHWKA